MGRIFQDSLDMDYTEKAKKDVKEKAEGVERDTELSKRVLEEDRDFDLQWAGYPEN